MVLTFDAFNETIEEAEKTKKEFEQLKENQTRIEKTISSMLKVIMGLSNTVEIHAPDHDPEITEFLRKWQGSKLAKSNG
jgi:transcription termination factor NusB